MDFPHRLPTEEKTREAIAALELDIADPRASDFVREFSKTLLAGHQRHLAEFIAEREKA